MKRGQIAFLLMYSECRVAVIILGLFLAVPLVGLLYEYVIVTFPSHTHIL